MLNKCSPPEKGGGCSSGGSLASKARETGGRRQKGKRDRKQVRHRLDPLDPGILGPLNLPPTFQL